MLLITENKARNQPCAPSKLTDSDYTHTHGVIHPLLLASLSIQGTLQPGKTNDIPRIAS